jgi:WD40 repeat protein
LTLSGLVLTAALVGAFPRAPVAPPDQEEIRRLIVQLGSSRYKDREVASKKLEAIGEPAWYPLCKAAASPDLETRRRAQKLVQAIGKRLFVEVRHFGGQGGYWLNRVAFTRDGTRAIATGGALIVYDLATGKELYRVLELSFARPGLALSRDGRFFLTSHHHDPVVRLGDVKSGKEVQTFKGHEGGVESVAFSADAGRAVSGGSDGTVRLWDVKTGKELRAFKAGAGAVRGVAFSPDSRHVLAGYAAGSNSLVRLWEAESGRSVWRLAGHSSDVTAVAFLPTGRSFLSGSTDGTVRQWDVATGKALRRMEHGAAVNDVAISPDGSWALSAGFGDRAVRLWDLSDGGLLFSFEPHGGAVLGVAFSPDGRQAMSCDSEYTVRLWRLPAPQGRSGTK